MSKSKQKHKPKFKITSKPVVIHRPPPISSSSMNRISTPLYEKKTHQPEVRYTSDVMQMIDYIISKSPKEVGWLGLVETKPYGYLITDLYVPEQTVSGTETDISEDAMANLAIEILDADLDPTKLLYWGHSHVNMAVSPSHQDETQIASFIENCSLFIRGIYNKQGESKVDVYDKDNNVVHQCVPNFVDLPELTKEQLSHLDELLKTNVKQQQFTNIGWKPSTMYQSSFLYDDHDDEYADLLKDPFGVGGLN